MPSFGDTPSVQVPIVARDETSAAFASATANVQRFAAQTTGAGTAMDYSMREARGGIMLLGEEIGVKLNRHVAGFLANLAPIGGAMSLAFAPLAIVNLIQLAEMLAEKVTKVSAKTKELAEEQKKLYEQVNKGLLAVGKSDVETAK